MMSADTELDAIVFSILGIPIEKKKELLNSSEKIKST